MRGLGVPEQVKTQYTTDTQDDKSTHTHTHKTNTHNAHTWTKRGCSAWMRQKAVITEKKNSSSQDCVRGMCVESTHPVMHMPCKKPRPQGVCLTPGRGKREKKINVEIVSSLEPSEGVQTVSVLRASSCYILQTFIYSCQINYDMLV